ncbi:hypothetical protein EGT74_00390 [Chitinophaga lutea]|uniref:TonB-dependent receptor n=1 Tax=Chitinophaga lutea TaxID=2488634 RepID=A0A3N4Q7S3_9BACT|nr:hypothetical protein [Chitinophaga lutea]RPE12050.1 hypothetical protein EGT74_00390 [Chitinophaga lutea]
MKYLLPFLLLPSLAHGQWEKPVEPVLSADYLELIRKPRAALEPVADSSMRIFRLARRGYFHSNVGSLKVRGNAVSLAPANTLNGWLTGSLNTALELRQANRGPSLQNTYAQGRALTWRGAETGEMFSFGPAMTALEFDGSIYPFDAGGKLVPAGAGNGQPAKPYDNGIFRTASYLSQSLSLNGGIRSTRQGRWAFNTKLGYSRENTFIRHNENSSRNLSASVTKTIPHFTFTGSYQYLRDELSNSNRNGFLNRAYMNALLTPASFDNSYKSGAYGNGADNPLSLLGNSGNDYRQTQRNAGLMVKYDWNDVEVIVTQAYENIAQKSGETYQPGAAFFPAGINTQRDKTDRSYYLKAEADARIPNYWDHGSMRVEGIFLFTDDRSSTGYQPQQLRYQYQRSNGHLQLRYKVSRHLQNTLLEATAGNAFYFSNTAVRPQQFAPLVNVYASFHFGGYNRYQLEVTGSMQALNSELPVDNSMAYTNLLQYSTGHFMQYFPLLETGSYDRLRAAYNRTYTGRAVFRYKYKFALSAEWFRKDVRDDAFPIYDNGRLQLQNIAGHRRQGVELQLNQYAPIQKKTLRTSNTLSFLRYRHRVTQVADGYNGTPIAGFSNVHKAVIAGETLGAIVGNRYRRDAANNVIIGADGFPLVDGTPSVIGNPLPDFVMKLSNSLFWKEFTLATDLEWKKGGQIWDGTQATLDYYGRSAESAAQRNTSGHVFKGVLENGHPNTIPVSFYDPANPLDENRWVRYGLSGVAEDYIRDAGSLRLNMVELRYSWNIGKVLRRIDLAAYATNIVLWTASEGTDPNQLLLDHTSGLDFFNLPSTRTYGINVSLQF